jgi:(5-formylfuran-3-yl)methyl phosphate synthase
MRSSDKLSPAALMPCLLEEGQVAVTGLLVSVRDSAEAATALRGGATLIDVKEPRHGSLGRASAERWQEVAQRVAERVPVSVACGELLEEACAASPAALASVTYIKCGLAGCSAVPDWPRRWSGWLRQLPREIQPVAVAYADWQRALAPRPEHVLRWAVRLHCRVMLWDTHTKDGTCLLDHLSRPALHTLTRAAHQQGLLVVLAGSVSPDLVPALLSFAPDYLAVRGAACGGDRQGVVREHLVKQLVRSLAPHVQPAHHATADGRRGATAGEL